MVDPATPIPVRPLLAELLTLVVAHRPAVRHERVAQRQLGLLLGWLCGFGRHTLTQVLLALGLGDADGTAWHRLFSRPRLDYDRLTSCLLGEMLGLVAVTAPHLVAVDATQLGRRSLRRPGTSWLRHPGTPVFRFGIQRAQRFVHLAWLPLPTPTGYSRAVPLRFAPAFPAKAVSAVDHPPRNGWEAAVAMLGWRRQRLDAAGRQAQRVLALGDGQYSTRPVWIGLPERVTVLARCARNRAFYALPDRQPGRGRRCVYGDRQPRPDAWLHARRGGRRAVLTVCGRTIPITYRVEGPCLVKGAAARPLFLLVVKGIDQRAKRKRQRDPSFWLVSAVATDDGAWALPWSAADLLAWAWQRWEIEVAHRELKASSGLGEPQCWNARGGAERAVDRLGLCRRRPRGSARLGTGPGTAPGARPLVGRRRPLVVGAAVARLWPGIVGCR